MRYASSIFFSESKFLKQAELIAMMSIIVIIKPWVLAVGILSFYGIYLEARSILTQISKPCAMIIYTLEMMHTKYNA